MLIGILLFSAASAPAFIKVRNATFVNDRGKEVFFKGIGLGGWLVPEGYMLHFPGFGSPTSINNQVVDVIGTQNAQLFWKTYRANYVNEEDVAAISRMGFNLIRLPFNYRLLSPQDQPGVYSEEGFAVIDKLIDWCAQNRLYLILDMHCAPGGQNAGNISDSDGQEARLWTDADNQSRTVDIWQHIAQRYAHDTTIVGYDLLNEPVLPAGHAASELRNLYMRITQAIRQVDSIHIIFVEGNWYATDFNALTPPWDVNMAYSFHKYWNATDASTIQDYLNMRKTYHVPLWMGESGENSNHWFAAVVKLLQDNNISWCWWTHKKFATTTSPYSAALPDDFDLLSDYWQGKADKPSTASALSILMRFAENLKLKKCRYLPDVPDALFNTNFFTQSKPFKTHSLPGSIACVDYDLGANGLAYWDADYQRTQYDPYTPWNRGGSYRNDGVDIEQSHDAQGPEYSVGWIESDEWLAYTVDVSTTDSFVVFLRFATETQGGRVQLFCDNEPLSAPLSLPSTGGWYRWDTVQMGRVALKAGKHQLRLKGLQGGFNIDQLQFAKLSATGSLITPPKRFRLGQNYPNPFNQSTRIPFYLAQTATVHMEIFDLKGQTVFEGSLRHPAGAGFFLWNGRDASNRPVASGIYFYRVGTGQTEQIKKMICLR